MNTLLIVVTLLLAVLLAQAVWTLAYALSPRRRLDERLKLFVRRN